MATAKKPVKKSVKKPTKKVSKKPVKKTTKTAVKKHVVKKTTTKDVPVVVVSPVLDATGAVVVRAVDNSSV